MVKFALADDMGYDGFLSWYVLNQDGIDPDPEYKPDKLKIHIDKDSIDVSKLAEHVGYKKLDYCGATLTFFKGYLVVQLRLEFTDPININKDQQKSFTIYSSKVQESYMVNHGLKTWMKMKKDPVMDFKTKFLCAEIHNKIKKHLMNLTKKPKNDYQFLD